MRNKDCRLCINLFLKQNITLQWRGSSLFRQIQTNPNFIFEKYYLQKLFKLLTATKKCRNVSRTNIKNVAQQISFWNPKILYQTKVSMGLYRFKTAMSSLHKGSFKITLTIPLKYEIYPNNPFNIECLALYYYKELTMFSTNHIFIYLDMFRTKYCFQHISRNMIWNKNRNKDAKQECVSKNIVQNKKSLILCKDRISENFCIGYT